MQAGHNHATSAALKRWQQVSEAVRKMAGQFPRQALAILNACLCPCRIQHIAQAVPCEEWTEDDIQRMREEGVTTLQTIAGLPLTPTARQQANLSPQNGGLGLAALSSRSPPPAWQC